MLTAFRGFETFFPQFLITSGNKFVDQPKNFLSYSLGRKFFNLNWIGIIKKSKWRRGNG